MSEPEKIQKWQMQGLGGGCFQMRRVPYGDFYGVADIDPILKKKDDDYQKLLEIHERSQKGVLSPVILDEKRILKSNIKYQEEIFVLKHKNEILKELLARGITRFMSDKKVDAEEGLKWLINDGDEEFLEGYKEAMEIVEKIK